MNDWGQHTHTHTHTKVALATQLAQPSPAASSHAGPGTGAGRRQAGTCSSRSSWSMAAVPSDSSHARLAAKWSPTISWVAQARFICSVEARRPGRMGQEGGQARVSRRSRSTGVCRQPPSSARRGGWRPWALTADQGPVGGGARGLAGVRLQLRQHLRQLVPPRLHHRLTASERQARIHPHCVAGVVHAHTYRRTPARL